MSAEAEGGKRVCRQRIYHGRVQGVGFRYTTVSIARSFPVTGYVKNLPDGTVELVAEGDENSVVRFLQEVEAYFQQNIRDVESEDLSPRGEFSQFEVRY